MCQDAEAQPGILRGEAGLKLQPELGAVPAASSKEKQMVIFLLLLPFPTPLPWRPKPSFP